jgi:hypothetical protein
MIDIRDVLAGRVEVDRFHFSQTVDHSGECQRRYYFWLAAGDQFLLMDTSIPIDPDQPIDLLSWGVRDMIFARTSEAEFAKNSDLPMLNSRPRAQSQPEYLSRLFQLQETSLRRSLQLGLSFTKPGSVRWEGDQLTAEYLEHEGGRGAVRITNADGTEASEEVKARMLAQIEAQSEGRGPKATFVGRSHSIKVQFSKEAEAERLRNTPAPGSIEARIMEVFAVREQERIRKGIRGTLVRDEQSRAVRLDLECYPARRIEFEYESSAQLPPPFPTRVKSFLEHAEARPGIPLTEMVLYSVRYPDRPLPDSAFDPRQYLKPGSFCTAVLSSDGRSRVPDRDGQMLLNRLARERHSQRRHGEQE